MSFISFQTLYHNVPILSITVSLVRSMAERDNRRKSFETLKKHLENFVTKQGSKRSLCGKQKMVEEPDGISITNPVSMYLSVIFMLQLRLTLMIKTFFLWFHKFLLRAHTGALLKTMKLVERIGILLVCQHRGKNHFGHQE